MSVTRDKQELDIGRDLQSLLDFFTQIDHVHCFLKKSKSTTLLSTIKRVFETLFGHDSFTHDKLELLLHFNQFIQVCHLPGESSALALEFVKPFSGTSTAVIQKRQISCRTAFVKYLKNQHDCLEINEKWSIQKNGWHSSFDVNAVRLPILSPPVEIPSSIHGNSSNNSNNMNSNTTAFSDLLHAITTNNIDHVSDVLNNIKKYYFYKRQICHYELLKSKNAEIGVLSHILNERVLTSLRLNGITSLYTHQTQGINALLNHKHIIVTTSTSSGKSLIYNIPVLHTIALNINIRALYIFPTKALAHDQFKNLMKLVKHFPITHDNNSISDGIPVVSTFDGDSSYIDKDESRIKSNIILTNADSIHYIILPNHKKWKIFFENLRFIVIDEAHIYRGGFGTHVAMILRRLIRICLLYNTNPQIICCSASVANPLCVISSLVPLQVLGGEDKVEVIEKDGSAHGSKLVIVWNSLQSEEGKSSDSSSAVCTNPPLSKSPVKRRCDGEMLLSKIKKKRKGLSSSLWIDKQNVPEFLVGCEDSSKSFPEEIRGRVKWRGSITNQTSVFEYAPSMEFISSGVLSSGDSTIDSSLRDITLLFIQLISNDIRTLVFCASRNLVETIVTKSISEAKSFLPDFNPNQIVGYRAGYSAEDRRQIERSFESGALRGIVGTSALEVGVDIGLLNATLHLGYPGSNTSLWQQIGRAGRANQTSVSILVCTRSPPDQFVAKNPSILFKGGKDSMYINTTSPQAIQAHLMCAANEIPLNYQFSTLMGRSTDECIWGVTYLESVQALLQEGVLGVIDEIIQQTHVLYRYRPIKEKNPSKLVSIRQMESVEFIVLDESRGDKEIDKMEQFRAFKNAYEGSVFSLQGKSYLVRKLDLNASRIYCSPCNVDYKTTSECSMTITVTKVFDTRGIVSTGSVTQRFYNWRYRKILNSKIMSENDCFLPDIEHVTPAVWVHISDTVIDSFQHECTATLSSLPIALHTLLHALMAVAPTIVQCGMCELQGEHEYADGFPHRILLYEMKAGGIGIAETIFIEMLTLFDRAALLLQSCQCVAGCFSCLLDYRCPMDHSFYNKINALKLLQLLREELSLQRN